MFSENIGDAKVGKTHALPAGKLPNPTQEVDVDP